ncbi:hypothetical protein KKG41_01415 [Patescibacteria group bacterium]|nr:hypothetical protein [Patescibacteria group bacterium]MBU1890575.1 hypothetical protein [Patescibacteria group bacterium]
MIAIRQPENIVGYGFVFLIAFAFFFVLQYHDTLSDPDSFYHAKMALLMKEQGVITQFPWLGEFTVLGEAYIDQHFLYHVLLIPFVSALHPIIGLKIATTLFASLFVVTFYWLLRRLHMRWAAWLSLLLLLMNPLVFRLSLAKAPSLSLIVLLIGSYFIVKQRWKPLVILSFIYVWLYGGFAVIILSSGLYFLIDIVVSTYRRIFNSQSGGVNLLKVLTTNKSWKSLVATIVGVILGIVVNPYFPQNLFYYRYQLFEIGIKNYRDIIGVGGEWYPYVPIELVGATVLLTLAFIGALVLFLIKSKRNLKRNIFFLALAAFFLLLTFKSRRYVEYYIPMACLFSFTIYGSLFWQLKPGYYWKRLVYFKSRKKIMVALVVLYFLITVPTIIVQRYIQERNSMVNSIPHTKFLEVSQWLSSHSDKGDIVFHSSWDEFPMLFYHNDTNYYIGGLDQTFMYLYNKDLHKKWVDITTGKQSENLYEIISGDFKARYVLASQKHTAMKRNIKSVSELEKVYEDSEAVVYEVH